MCISQNHIPILFVCQCTTCPDAQPDDSRQLDNMKKAFCVSKLERLHAYFFARLIKAVLYPLFTFCAICIRFLVHPDTLIFTAYLIAAYSTQGTTKRGIKYLLSITSLNYWAYIILMVQEINKSVIIPLFYVLARAVFAFQFIQAPNYPPYV